MLHTREETAEVDLQLHSTKTVALLLGQFEPLEIPLRVVTYHGSQDNGDGGRQRWQGRTRWWQRVRESRRMRRQTKMKGWCWRSTCGSSSKIQAQLRREWELKWI